MNTKTTLLAILCIAATLTLASCGKGSKNKGNKIEENVTLPPADTATVEGMTLHKVEFPSMDGLLISADVYQIDSVSPVIVLCHQAGQNSYEYAEIAPKLAEMGFNCIAINQRSGGKMEDYPNATFDRAIEQKLPTAYIDAEQDIIAGVNYAFAKWKKPVILWGSSYAAGLSLKNANHNDAVVAVIAFSPGEYFDDKTYIKKSLIDYDKKVFVTSTEKESGGVAKLMSEIPANLKTLHFPESRGTHGSKALWSTDAASKEYWDAIIPFLISLK